MRSSRLPFEHSQNVLYDNTGMSRGLCGLFLLLEVDDIARSEDVGVVGQLEGRQDSDMVRRVENVFTQRLPNEFGVGRGADGWNLRWRRGLLSLVSGRVKGRVHYH